MPGYEKTESLKNGSPCGKFWWETWVRTLKGLRSIIIITSVVTIHRCIDVSRYLSRDMYRDTVCNNRDTSDLATFLRFLFECLTDINCQSAKNYQCHMSSHPQQTAGSYSQLKSIKLCRLSVISNKWSYD